MNNKKCEYCSFGDYGSFGFDCNQEHVRGLYGKPMEAKEDLLSSSKHYAYDTLKLVKSNKGYFLEAPVTDPWEHDTYHNYTKAGFCPKCGNKLPKFDAKKFINELCKEGL